MVGERGRQGLEADRRKGCVPGRIAERPIKAAQSRGSLLVAPGEAATRELKLLKPGDIQSVAEATHHGTVEVGVILVPGFVDDIEVPNEQSWANHNRPQPQPWAIHINYERLKQLKQIKLRVFQFT
jgi:hypothetical protein